MEKELENLLNDEGSDYIKPALYNLPRKIKFCKLTLRLGLHTEESSQGVYSVTAPSGKTLLYAPPSGKWRQPGKSKWYWSKSPEDFIDKYLLK